MRNTVLVLWPKTQHPALVRYLATSVVLAIAVLVRVALADELGLYPLLLFIPAVFLSALLFGRALGLFATLVSAVLAVMYFMRPAHLQAFEAQALPVGVFLLIGVLISTTIERLHEALREVARSESEKALLLEELTHRTRNDLMMVSSALALQARSITDPGAKSALDSALARIAVITKAHERLGTAAGHRGFVELGGYLRALCDGLNVLLRDIRPVALRVEAPALEARSDQAVTVGLIVNELVTNALKHAFPDERAGTVVVQVSQTGDGLQLVVADDGGGCPDSPSGGMGSRLVRMLAAQYGGEVERGPGEQGGCRIRVTLRSVHLQPSAAAEGAVTS